MRRNACETLALGRRARSPTAHIALSGFELPLLGSNQDSPDPESGVLPVTPRGTVPKDDTVGSSGRARPKNQNRGEWGVGSGTSRRGTECAARTVTYHSPLPTPLCHRGPGRETAYGAEGARTPDLLGAIQALSQLSYSPVGCGT